MTATEIQRLLHSAPPGTTINIVSITIPGPTAHSFEIEPAGVPDDEGNPESTIQRLLTTQGDGGLKLREWTRLLPYLPLRRLKAAIRSGELRWHRKPAGKDHGATLVSPSAMLEYLSAPTAAGIARERVTTDRVVPGAGAPSVIEGKPE